MRGFFASGLMAAWFACLPVLCRAEAVERGAIGVVVGADGLPVAGARVRLMHIRTPGAGLIESDGSGDDTVVTGADGRFRIEVARTGWDGRFRVCDPVEPEFEFLYGVRVPPGSRYFLNIEAPGEPRRLPFVFILAAGEETRCTLSREEARHRVSFQDSAGRAIAAEAIASATKTAGR